ncbi:MAG: transcription elongation factor GreB [Gammaproteobacteria bacterium]|nr:transcription elongation factor GreB [Gammaproteobacteria bacterium]
MSRYRPPSAPSSAYITAAGYARLKAEYEHLWHQRRPEVVKALAAAAAEGDRSENAEYIYRKKELREIDRRVHYLQKRIPELKVVDRTPADPARAFFGAWVEVADESGEARVYRIVGPDETDAAQGCISVDSPLARALLKKREGESLRAALPGGERELELLRVWYE